MILLTVMARCSAPIGLERAIFTPAGIPRRGASGGCALEGRLLVHRPVRGAFDGRIGDLGHPRQPNDPGVYVAPPAATWRTASSHGFSGCSLWALTLFSRLGWNSDPVRLGDCLYQLRMATLPNLLFEVGNHNQKLPAL
jgi:hypothetical protein